MSADLGRLEIRRARTDEADVIADVFWAARHANADTIPLLVHPLEDVRRWVQEQLLDRHEVWVAEAGGEVVGFMALGQPDWIEHLYLRPDASGHGLGSRFVDLAKRELTGQIQLWTFQSNLGARRFYGRHGFVEVQWTDGDNEEGAPDVRLLFSTSVP